MSNAKKTNAQKILGARIAEIRKARNLTQAELSELIGIAPTTLTNIELGKRFLTAATLDKIKKVLEVKYKDLFKDYPALDAKANYIEEKEILEHLYKFNPDLIPAAKAFLELLDK